MNCGGLGRTIAALTTVTALAACSGPMVSARQRTDEAWNFTVGVMQSGPMLVEVLGNPYGVSDAAFADAVIADMKRGITWYADPRFTTDPNIAGSRRMRIILAFNGGPGGNVQCRGGAGGGGAASQGAVRLNATLCDDTQLLSDVAGSVAETRGMDDPDFRQLVADTTRALLPQRSNQPERDPVPLM